MKSFCALLLILSIVAARGGFHQSAAAQARIAVSAEFADTDQCRIIRRQW